MKRAIVLFLILSLILSGCSSNIKITSDYTSLDFKYLKEHESYKYENLYHTLLADPREISDKWSIVSVKRSSSKRPQMNFDNIKFDIISAYNYIEQDITNDNISRLISEDISFSSLTKWPSSEFLPEGFDPNSILEINKTPGLNVKDLHKKGINGEGVGIAIIDQTLFYDHSEYREQIAYYEEMHNGSEQAMHHGSALASFTVGKNVESTGDGEFCFNIMDIKDLQAYAESIMGKPENIEKSSRVIGVSEYRDGTIIDYIYGVK